MTCCYFGGEGGREGGEGGAQITASRRPARAKKSRENDDESGVHATHP